MRTTERQVTETQAHIAQQINARELKLAKFTIMASGEDALTLKKGKKFLKIQYNSAADLYDLEKGRIKGFDIQSEEVKDVYFDQIQSYIEAHFGFEYVMERLAGAYR